MALPTAADVDTHTRITSDGLFWNDAKQRRALLLQISFFFSFFVKDEKKRDELNYVKPRDEEECARTSHEVRAHTGESVTSQKDRKLTARDREGAAIRTRCTATTENSLGGDASGRRRVEGEGVDGIHVSLGRCGSPLWTRRVDTPSAQLVSFATCSLVRVTAQLRCSFTTTTTTTPVLVVLTCTPAHARQGILPSPQASHICAASRTPAQKENAARRRC